MNNVLFHIKRRLDNDVIPARCKHCKFFDYEYDKFERIDFFGYCNNYCHRVVCNCFACDQFDPKPYFICVDKVKQLTLF